MQQAVKVFKEEIRKVGLGQRPGGIFNWPGHFWAVAGMGLSLIAGSVQGQTVPSTFRLESSLADTSQPGFVWRVHQVSTWQANDNTRTEQQLAGLLGDNIADPNATGIANGPAAPASPATAPISFEIDGVVNLNKVGGWWDGWFGPDDQMPGIPGTMSGDENVAAELLTWLDLPAGWIVLVVNSDDGFRLTLGGSTPNDQFAMLAGEFNGGRGPSDSYCSFYVEQAGLYAARCTWEQGQGGASLELYSYDYWSGNRVLINDTANGGIPAYRAVTEPTRAYARRVSPANGQGAPAIAPVTVELVDGASPIEPSSMQLSIDGITVAVTRSKTGEVTTITYDHVMPFVPGSHNVSFSYLENGVVRTVGWQFTALEYVGPNGNFYEFVPARNIPWEDAKALAEQRRFLCGVAGHLATITSQEEDVFVELLRQQYASSGALPWGTVWAGGFQLRDQPTPADGWFWVNNEGPIPAQIGGSLYSNWNPAGEPNDCCGAAGGEDNEENNLVVGFNGGTWNDENVSHNNIVGFVVEYERPVTPIDVKPGSSTNPLYLDRPGKLPVAVLSTATFSASTINVATVRFGRTGTETTPMSSALSDVNGDKRKDLVCQFNAQDTGLRCGDTTATLTAVTVTGCAIKGTDTVTVLGCPPYNLSVTSMQDVNQVTDVILKVAPILPGRVAPTVAQNIVLKSEDIFGHPRWSKTLQNIAFTPAADGTSSVELQYPDVQHGQNVKARMQVADTTGVEQVLTGEGRTVYRPDLAAVAPNSPVDAFRGQFVNIFASVSELKGDLSASGTVYLKDANGNVLDLTQSVLVGPHGSVGVMFTTVFGTEGVQNLAIEVAAVNPGDYDLSNNRQSFTVSVGPPPTYYSAQYYFHSHDYWHQEANAFWLYTYSEQLTNEYVSQTLYIPAELQFPIGRVTLEVSADGINRGGVDLTDVPLLNTYGNGCEVWNVGSVDLGNNSRLYIQSYWSCWGGQQDSVTVSRSTYSLVYHSEYHDLVWGTVDKNSFDYLDLAPWDVRTSIDTRFVVQDDAGTFGGNGNFGVINYWPFDYSWDYWMGYFEPDDTHVTGYNRGHDASAYNYGVAVP